MDFKAQDNGASTSSSSELDLSVQVQKLLIVPVLILCTAIAVWHSCICIVYECIQCCVSSTQARKQLMVSIGCQFQTPFNVKHPCNQAGPSVSPASVATVHRLGNLMHCMLLQQLQMLQHWECPLLQVLTTGSWPTQTAPKCTLPREVEQACTRFRDFYLSTHSGRKLSWQTNMGNAGKSQLFAGSNI